MINLDRGGEAMSGCSASMARVSVGGDSRHIEQETLLPALITRRLEGGAHLEGIALVYARIASSARPDHHANLSEMTSGEMACMKP